jgi:hypothetical protein
LGNSADTLDLGEVLDFVRFRGHPNDFGPGSDNYSFWDSILRGVGKELGELDFDRLAKLQSAVDSHKSFLAFAILGDRFRSKEVAQYRTFIKALYDRILAEPFDVLIDSSKYPSRLLHLRRVFHDERLHVIHLVRNPIELARAMKSANQLPRKSFLQTMFYFFVINVLSLIATRRLGQNRCLRLHYEDLVSQPEKTLDQIGRSFSIDTSPAVEKIRCDQPLDRGYVFNGNRMRMQGHVVLRKSSGVTMGRSLLERGFEHLARLAFGSAGSARRG